MADRLNELHRARGDLKLHGREKDPLTTDHLPPEVYTADPDGLRIQLQDVSFCGGLGALGNECRG